jgi:hypothetical protein
VDELITNLGRVDVPAGQMVAQGTTIGRTPDRRSTMLIELRQGSRPVSITPCYPEPPRIVGCQLPFIRHSFSRC